ncbi:scarecrow-like protein 14 [Malania oleifera]|uniref:scarecrow-like protein 14 n=1 Tax=Malania oleifera TaxID=397392 RepID=UPI0025AE9E02|nr:scarecrow-like protein 14 [Malania oleifera]
MIMDPKFGGYNGSMGGSKFNDEPFANPSLPPFFDMGPANSVPSVSHANSVPSVSHDGELCEDCDFSDVVLKYINQMLMEDDMDEKNCMFQESNSAALQVAEKSLYEVLGEKYPPSPDHQLPYVFNQKFENHTGNYNDCNNNSSLEDPCYGQSITINWNAHSSSQFSLGSSRRSSSGSDNVVKGYVESPVGSSVGVPDTFSQSESIMQFKRGVEEAHKFLPDDVGLFVNLNSNVLFTKEPKEEAKNLVVVEEEEKHESKDSLDGLRGRKNHHHPEDVELESGRGSKQSAVYTEATVRSEMFDRVLLCQEGNCALQGSLQSGASKNVQQNIQLKQSNGGKGHGKKQGQGGKKDLLDLPTLLTQCAQAVAANDRNSANDLLKQIRQHSCPTGDGIQRLARYFADGLEARLAGSGTQIYTALISKPVTAADILKAYHLFLIVCPFKKLANFFSNKTIMNVAEKATRLHIIDFGILYGFQWPSFIQRLSSRPGGPPKLRITGIDFPRPGFRPTERIEETGHRLANYAESFNVPFEFNAIAKNWETIRMEDFRIDSDEVLVVNSVYRFRNLLDETVVLDSPRSIVLNLIKEMNPDVFIQGIVNGAHNAPFFITRFREALFHYSAQFDMLETTVPREIPERMLLEKEILGRGAMNVIACEGSERIERPETYRQWQVRNLRAGFRQLPLSEEIVTIAKKKTAALYHKDFIVNEDGQWLLQGWKGRILYALSSWKPVH